MEDDYDHQSSGKKPEVGTLSWYTLVLGILRGQQNGKVRLISFYDYRTRVIISRSLYTFYPLFEVQKRFFQGSFILKLWLVFKSWL